MQRSSAAAERDAVLDAAEIGEFALEGFDFRALHERGTLADTVERRKNFVAQLRVFGLQVQQRNFHHGGALTHGKTLRQGRPHHKSGETFRCSDMRQCAGNFSAPQRPAKNQERERDQDRGEN